jgi:hypothetical protein
MFAAVRIGERHEKSDPRLLACFDIAAADGVGVRCPPSCLLVGVRPADLDIRHAIPERQTAARQRHEVVAKDAIADEPLGVRAAVSTEGSDAPAFDVGNVDSHEVAQFRDAARVGEPQRKKRYALAGISTQSGSLEGRFRHRHLRSMRAL